MAYGQKKQKTKQYEGFRPAYFAGSGMKNCLNGTIFISLNEFYPFAMNCCHAHYTCHSLEMFVKVTCLSIQNHAHLRSRALYPCFHNNWNCVSSVRVLVQHASSV